MYELSPITETINSIDDYCSKELKSYNESIATTALLGAGVATMILGKDRMIDIISQTIEIIRNIINFILAQLRKLWKWFMINSRDIHKDNILFLQKYEKKLMLILDREVIIDGYDNNIDIERVVNTLTAETRLSDITSHLIDIYNNESSLRTRDDVTKAVNLNRMNILDLSTIGTNLKPMIVRNSEFRPMLIEKLYGKRHSVVHNVGSALETIKKYIPRVALINDTKRFIEDYANRDLEGLIRNREKLNSSGIVATRFRSDIITQFNLLIEYKQRVLVDFLTTFDIISKYVNEMNTQAKFICIQALKED